jgi:hypothetical protein
MSNEELIAKAREQVRDFYEDIKGTEPGFPHPDTLTNARVRQTVTIYFTDGSGRSSAEVALDRETGEFVGATFSPPNTDAHPRA